ncbi:MAG: UTP--glucose-1-phosphate uridylyltransferase GalU [Alphaproteobacteria bacterium]|nr:UTP--glucose-1-phosphate uridylyltransferase GalU [Alphaproteobacteria bacterium]MCL2504951.1 UTP--glucose-1-phosphate uridylyltransferase GalU [Alphaproteobacteria bacterium]
MKQRIRKAVFPVAGLGTRILPATKAIPKEMLPCLDKPLIQHAVDEARAAGIEQFIFVTSKGKTVLEDHFDINQDLNKTLEAKSKHKALQLVKDSELPAGSLFFTRQAVPLGLGHAVWCARHLVGNEPFAVLLPDDIVLSETPCLKQMTDVYGELGGNIVSVMEVPRSQTNKYGILDVGKESQGGVVEIKGLIEKPEPEKAPSCLSIIGRYILQPEIFTHLNTQSAGSGGEIQLTDSMAKLIGTQPFHGFRFKGTRYDCGDRIGFITANLAFALRDEKIAEEVRANVKELLEI